VVTTPVPQEIDKISDFCTSASMAPILAFNENQIGEKIEATGMLSVPQSDIYLLCLEYIESVPFCDLDTRHKGKQVAKKVY
jgi:hypothetical protein